jgi:hypothetical protein
MSNPSPHLGLHDARATPAYEPLPAVSDDEALEAALHRASTRSSPNALPEHVARRLNDLIDAGIAGPSLAPPVAQAASGQAASGQAAPGQAAPGPAERLSGAGSPRNASRWPLIAALAAGLALASSIALFTRYRAVSAQASSLAQQLAKAQDQVEVNQRLIAAARSQIEQHGAEVQAIKVAELAAVQQLADATASHAARQRELQSQLDAATLTIASLEAPIDPATVRQNRTKLLEVPGTVRLAWAPFNVDGAPPAEQAGVQGDVVWNDELQTGYLRFVGLAANDPAREQYQVWVIDERGMEQKVSGGVFNANADGEVIVPIRPGIDVGRVALFAVTVENPGGTWVPDLRRRVVIAPRG